MGYYVDGYGNASFKPEQETELVQKLKDLNHRHELKTGGCSPKSGDPYKDKWFAWMPADYHTDESLTRVQDILELVGFEVSEHERDGSVVLDLAYNNKTGCEQTFLEELARAGAKVSMNWKGEEGEEWAVRGDDGSLQMREMERSWGAWKDYSEAGSVVQFNNVLEMIANAFTEPK